MDIIREKCRLILYSWIYMGIICLLLPILGLMLDIGIQTNHIPNFLLFSWLLPLGFTILYVCFRITDEDTEEELERKPIFNSTIIVDDSI